MSKDCGCHLSISSVFGTFFVDHSACLYREIIPRSGEDRRIQQDYVNGFPNDCADRRTSTQDRREVARLKTELEELRYLIKAELKRTGE